MPANLRYRTRQRVELSGPAALHLTEGDCFLAGGCSACAPTGDDLGPGCPRPLDLAIASGLWTSYKRELRAAWSARLDAIGAPGWPCFAELVIDRAPLPPLPADAAPEARELHGRLSANAAALADFLEAQRRR